MPTYATIALSIITTLIALFALRISFLTFQRQKTYEFQNHLFRFKIDRYAEILKTFYEILTYYSDIVPNTFDQFKTKQIGEDRVYEISDEVDEKTDTWQDKILQQTIFLPDEIAELIDAALDKLYDEIDTDIFTEKEYIHTMKQLDELNEILEKLEEAMTNDLGVKKLHKHLQKRIRS